MVAQQNDINKVIIHCTDTNDAADIGIDQVNKWHQERGFEAYDGITFCGYHYIIRRDGSVDRGRPEWIRGAHTYGFNTGSIAVAWVGRNELGPRQRTSLVLLVDSILRRYKLTIADVFGHCDFTTQKTCPNFNSVHTYLSINAFRDDLMLIRGDS